MTLTRLSKFMSLILRHRPQRFGLTLDAEGFVPLAVLTQVVADETGHTLADILAVVERGDKQRFEIRGDMIRARYGHSSPKKIGVTVGYPTIEPPEILYHGTRASALLQIRQEGLRAMSRQYVHLSATTERAEEVAHRRTEQPILLTIRAQAAHATGIEFYCPEPNHYLARAVPAEFITFPQDYL